MIFDSNFWPLALLVALVSAGVFAAFNFFFKEAKPSEDDRYSYRYNERSQDTVPQALTCALEACDYEDAIRNAISIGGDSDTIAAIAGAVAEAQFGISDEMAAEAWRFLPAEMRVVLQDLYAIAK